MTSELAESTKATFKRCLAGTSRYPKRSLGKAAENPKTTFRRHEIGGFAALINWSFR
jgi:hypothetical protein